MIGASSPACALLFYLEHTSAAVQYAAVCMLACVCSGMHVHIEMSIENRCDHIIILVVTVMSREVMKW